MNQKQRVLAALDFQPHDHVPMYDAYWPEFIDAWRQEKAMPQDADITDYYQNDVEIVIPVEAPFPSQEAVLESGRDYEIRRTAWGMVQRVDLGAKFYRVLDVALPERSMLGSLRFESPLLDERFDPVERVDALKEKRCVFVKTGGPYLRTTNLRDVNQWLMDMVEDPGFALELAMCVTRQMTAVGLEAMRRYRLHDTGVWFFDDMGSNRAPMFSPRTFERVLYPCYKWMCEQYRAAGVKRMMLHCDGNIEPILDMLIDAGIHAYHPVEPKAGMDIVRLRDKYGQKLAFLGGLDNAHILTNAPLPELREHVLRVLSVATEGNMGGLVIGAHSIGPDVSVERYDFVHQLIVEHGRF
jgi:uroporphyrinogen decarboxylase